MSDRQPRVPWRDHLTDEERVAIIRADLAKSEWQRLSAARAQIINRAIQRAKYAARNAKVRP